MNAIQERLIEDGLKDIARTLANANKLPTLAERAAIFENRLVKTRYVLEALQAVEQVRRDREQANAGAAA